MKRTRSTLSRLFAVFFCLSLFAAAQSPNQSSYTKQFYTTQPSADVPLAVDLNNDGVKDIVTANQSNFLIAVQLSDGNGGFSAPRNWDSGPFPGSYTVHMAAADLDQDGNADVLVADNQQKVTIYFGDGQGGFCTTCSNLATPFTATNVAVADVNHDGHPDIIVGGIDTNSTAVIAVFYGNGGRSFTAPSYVYTEPAVASGIDQMVVGDFDGDVNIDIAFTRPGGCDRANACTTSMSVLYGDGAGGHFTKAYSNTFNFAMWMTSFDVDKNGRSDLAFTAGCAAQCASGVGVMYGQLNRTFDIRQTPAAGGQQPNGSPIVADFNGDGYMDIAVTSQSTDEGILIAHADSSYGSWANQEFQPIASNGSGTFAGMITSADWNHDQKPDILQLTQNPSQLVELLNTTTAGGFADCSYPTTSHGIHICSPPTTTTSPFHVIAAANSFYPIRKTEFWIDGVKKQEVFTSWIDSAVTISDGPHTLDVYTQGYDNLVQKQSLSFTVGTGGGGGNCAVPTSPDVNICSPRPGDSVTSPFNVSAAGNNPGGTQGIDVWLDGNKVGFFPGNHADTQVSAGPGSHQLDVFARANDQSIIKRTVTFTVTGGTCGVPASPGVNICAPANGATVDSPVTITAYGKNTVATAGMDVWVDGSKLGWYANTNTVNAQSAMSPGTHRLDVYAVGTNGEKLRSTSIFTVGGGAPACSLPASPGVHICSPTEGQTIVGQEVHVAASGRNNNIPTQGIDVWLDGNKYNFYLGDHIDITIYPVGPGNHQLDIFAISQGGTDVQKSTVHFTSQ